MLKKILSLMATLTLIAGSATTTTAWTEHKSQNNGNTQKQNSQSSQNYNLREGDNLSKNKSLPKPMGVDKLLNYKNVIYAKADDGLYESIDNGQIFTRNTSIQNYALVDAIYAYNGVIYVGTDNYGLYESIDNGQIFTRNTSIQNYALVDAIYAYNGVIYVGTDNYGLYESTNNGKSFTQNTSIPSNTEVINIYAYDDVVYVGTNNNGLYESTDNGNSFRDWNAAKTAGIDEVFAYNKILYVGTYNGLYQSTDNGVTFTQNTSISPNYSIYSIYAYKDTLYIDNGIGLYESTDYGKSFTQITSVPNSEIDTIYAYNGVIYVGTEDNGLWESKDGKSFTQNNYIPSDNYISLIIAYNNILYVGSDNGGGVRGLWESATYSTVNEPNQIINSYNDLLYANPINFTFDWTILSKVTISNNSSSTPTTKTLTSGSYQIKDDANYIVTFSLNNGDTVTKTFFLKNGYDFSQGINAVTWDPTTRMLDILLSKKTSTDLLNNYKDSKQNILDFLTIVDGWTDLISNKDLETDLEDSLGAKQSEYEQLSSDVSIPSGTSHRYFPDYEIALQNKIDELNPSQQGVTAKGLIFKLLLNTDFTIANVPNTSQLKLPTGDDDFQTNYWDQILFNQN